MKDQFFQRTSTRGHWQICNYNCHGTMLINRFAAMKLLESGKLIKHAQFVGELNTLYKLSTFKNSIYSILNTVSFEPLYIL